MEKSMVKKLEVIREVGKTERCKSEIAQPYEIPISTLSTYLRN